MLPMKSLAISLVVKALLASSPNPGELRWRDDVRGSSDWDSAEAVAADGDEAFAIGGVADFRTGVMSILVRAYDVRTGEVVWSRELPSDGWAGGAHITVTPDVIFVVGSGEICHCDDPDVSSCWSEDPNSVCTERRLDWDGIVAAFDRHNGKRLWSRQVDSGGDDYLEIAVRARDRLILGGSLSDRSALTALVPSSGADDPNWPAPAARLDGHSYTDNLAVVGNLVIA